MRGRSWEFHAAIHSSAKRSAKSRVIGGRFISAGYYQGRRSLPGARRAFGIGSLGIGLHDAVDDQVFHPSAEPPRKRREGTQQPGMGHLTPPTEATRFHHEGAPHGR